MLCQGSKQHAMVRSTSGAVVALELNQWSNAPPKIAPLRLLTIIESFVMVLLLLLLMLMMIMMMTMMTMMVMVTILIWRH